MSIAVTGATGQLGGLVIQHLLKKVPASQIIAIVRNVEKASTLADQGVEVRHLFKRLLQVSPSCSLSQVRIMIIRFLSFNMQMS